MATIEQEQAELKRLNDNIKKILETSPESLVREQELGLQLSFRPLLPYFERINKLFRALKEYSLEDIPLGRLREVATMASTIAADYDKIKAFTPQQANAYDLRARIIQEVSDKYENVFNSVGLVLSYCIQQKAGTETTQEQLRKILKETTDEREQFRETLRQTNKERDEVLESLRSAAAEAGVSQHASYFKLEAEMHGRTAKWWLIGTIAAGLVAFSLVVYSIYYYSRVDIQQISLSQSVQLAVAKLIAFSLLYFALVWSSRNYRAHRHNYVVNKHRQNALSTFQAFVKAAGEDTATKNAVLLRSTEAIFSPVVTGYLIKEPEPQGTSQIIEIVRGALDKQQE